MASVTITIQDKDARNIDVNVHLNPQFPDSAIMYTNAQMIGKELMGLLQQLSNQINSNTNKIVL